MTRGAYLFYVFAAMVGVFMAYGAVTNGVHTIPNQGSVSLGSSVSDTASTAGAWNLVGTTRGTGGPAVGARGLSFWLEMEDNTATAPARPAADSAGMMLQVRIGDTWYDYAWFGAYSSTMVDTMIMVRWVTPISGTNSTVPAIIGMGDLAVGGGARMSSHADSIDVGGMGAFRCEFYIYADSVDGDLYKEDFTMKAWVNAY